MAPGFDGLYRLFGESNDDGPVNSLDFDASGSVNAFDFSQFRTRFGSGVP